MVNASEMLPTIRWIEFTIDFVLLVDVVVDLFTAYRVDTELVTDLRQVLVNYLSTYFFFDILSILPGLLTAEMYPEIYFLKLLRYVQFSRLLELLGVVVNKVSPLSRVAARQSVQAGRQGHGRGHHDAHQVAADADAVHPHLRLRLDAAR